MQPWEERADEARRLAPRASEPAVAARLLALLLDPENTAVSQAAADALLTRGDAVGVALFAEAFATAEEDTRDKLSDCLYDDTGDVWALVERLVGSLGPNAAPLARWMANAEK